MSLPINSQSAQRIKILGGPVSLMAGLTTIVLALASYLMQLTLVDLLHWLQELFSLSFILGYSLLLMIGIFKLPNWLLVLSWGCNNALMLSTNEV